MLKSVERWFVVENLRMRYNWKVRERMTTDMNALLKTRWIFVCLGVVSWLYHTKNSDIKQKQTDLGTMFIQRVLQL